MSDHAVLLRVPSAIVPAEWNYLIDPNHAYYPQLTIKPMGLFRVDPRLKR